MLKNHQSWKIQWYSSIYLKFAFLLNEKYANRWIWLIDYVYKYHPFCSGLGVLLCEYVAFWWLCARLQYLQCQCHCGGTTVLPPSHWFETWFYFDWFETSIILQLTGIIQEMVDGQPDITQTLKVGHGNRPNETLISMVYFLCKQRKHQGSS